MIVSQEALDSAEQALNVADEVVALGGDPQSALLKSIAYSLLAIGHALDS